VGLAILVIDNFSTIVDSSIGILFSNEDNKLKRKLLLRTSIGVNLFKVNIGSKLNV
jgi:hypothetical protein